MECSVGITDWRILLLLGRNQALNSDSPSFHVVYSPLTF